MSERRQIGSVHFTARPRVPRDAAKAYEGLRLLFAGKLEGVGPVDMDAVHRTQGLPPNRLAHERPDTCHDCGWRPATFEDSEGVYCDECAKWPKRQNAGLIPDFDGTVEPF